MKLIAYCILAFSSLSANAAPLFQGEYRVGSSCRANVGPSSVEGQYFAGVSHTDGGMMYVNFNAEMDTAECVFYMSERMKAVVTVVEGDANRTVTFHCGGKMSRIDGSVVFVISKVSGKIVSANQTLRYAKYATRSWSMPLVKENGTPILCE